MAESLNRGVYTEAGVPVLVAPTAKQIEKINGISKASYFSTVGNEVIIVPSDSVRPPGALDHITSSYFLKYCIDPLTLKIREDLRLLYGENLPERVGVRGTACSLMGTIECEDFLNNPTTPIRGLEEIMAEGSETGRDIVNTESRSLNDEPIVGGYALDYSVFYARKFRLFRKFKGLSTDATSPLILIYDLSFSDRGIVKLPKDDPGKAILRAYILDYPHS